MKKIVVASGSRYTDIDGLASAIAYQELLKLENKQAITVLSGPLNQSVTKTIKNWGLAFSNEFPKDDFDLVIVDISDPDHIVKSVDCRKIIELYDHRYGFKEYWDNKIGEKSVIEQVGACATLIWEQYKMRRLDKKISQLSANLLYTAIISNTLNFKASVTDKRDLITFRELKKFTKLPINWIEKYYLEQKKENFRNPHQAIYGDTKIQKVSNKLTLTIGQLELWESKPFIEKNLAIIKSTLASFGQPCWFFSSPSIKEGKNYFYTEDEKIKHWLEKTLKAKFRGNLGTTNKLWLRKEIIAKL